jgi:hypothetical protein
LKFQKEVSHLSFASISPPTDSRQAVETIITTDDSPYNRVAHKIVGAIKYKGRLLAPYALLAVFGGIAHAAPTIDMSGVTSVMQTVQTACLLIGAIIVLISLVFSVFSFAGGNIMRGITGVAGVLFGGLVIGLGPTWISSLTGQAVGG